MTNREIGHVVRKLVVRDVRLGMHDWEILDKYRLSHDENRTLPAIRRILMGDFVSDIR